MKTTTFKQYFLSEEEKSSQVTFKKGDAVVLKSKKNEQNPQHMKYYSGIVITVNNEDGRVEWKPFKAGTQIHYTDKNLLELLPKEDRQEG